ncbi:MAG TPA: hypothetical protein VGL20_03405 [Candidatus Dormibacteraeota bacterium]
MSEQDSGWKASVDGVVSEFDEVTRHLRVRQRQALRVVWSAVGAVALATGALIGLNLSSFPAIPGGQQPSLALLSPTAPVPAPVPGNGTPFFPGIEITPPQPEVSTPPSAVTAPATGPASAPRQARAVTPPAPPAPVASTTPVTAVITPPATEPPADPSGDPPAQSGLVDGLVIGVVHLLG